MILHRLRPWVISMAIWLAVATVSTSAVTSYAEAISYVGPDRIPWGDLDRPADESHDDVGSSPLRRRWILWPNDEDAALARSRSDPGVEVRRLKRLGPIWILEADADSAEAVTSRWSALGSLRDDRSGRPALSRSTALVGARSYVWDDLGLRGDAASSVAILDSGVDTAHDDLGDPDLDNEDLPPDSAGDADDWVDAAVFGVPSDFRLRVIGWYDVTDDMPNSAGPYDYHRHGTAIASAGFGSGRLDPLQTGVAPEARLVIVKTYNFEGRWEIWASDLLLGLDWVLTHRQEYRIRACLIGAVWDEDLGISGAVSQLIDAGIAVIAPAGNDPSLPMGYPARVDAVITVGATDVTGLVAAYSTPGPADVQRLDLMAPGGSTLLVDGGILVADNEPDDTYRRRVGSSLAAAHVAGAVSLVSEVLSESGIGWRNDRGQVAWLEDLLEATAAPTEGAEAGAVGVPRLNRLGADPFEGFGLLQIGAAVDAVRRILWPGEQASLTLRSPLDGAATWAARMPVTGNAILRIDLIPPADADFDICLYREEPDRLSLVAWGISGVAGRTESIQYRSPDMGWYVVVVRRVLGDGDATLLTDQRFAGQERWPLKLSSRQRSSPVAYDLDGDGTLEIIAVNNLANDGTGHGFRAFHADGRIFGLFPRFVFSPADRPGELTAPAIGDVGGDVLIVSGGRVGQVFAVDLDAQLRFATTLTDNVATTSCALWETGPGARILVGTQDGVVELDGGGAIVDTILLPSGAATEVALADTDGDGVEEIAVLDGSGSLHLLEIDGSEKPGWPIALGSGIHRAPVFLGNGNGADRLAISSVTFQGAGQLRLFSVDGSEAAGSPFVLARDPGAAFLALSGLSVAAASRGSALQLWASSIQQQSDGSTSLGLHRVDPTAGEVLQPSLEVLRVAFTDGLLGLPVRNALTPRVMEFSSRPQAEVFAGYELSWTELGASGLARFGSTERILGSNAAGLDDRLDFSVRNGHRFLISGGLVAPILADLDGDGRAEMVVARDNALYLQQGWMPTDGRGFWGLERGDARRSGCAGCEPTVVVGNDALPGRVGWRLRAHPNPFNPRTVLELEVAAGGRADWSLYDVRGRRLRRWSRVLPSAGVFQQALEAVDDHGVALASGVYFVRVELPGHRLQRRLTLVR